MVNTAEVGRGAIQSIPILVKDTSLAAIIGVLELTRAAAFR